MAQIATMRTTASTQAKRNHSAACQFADPSRRSISRYTHLMRSTSAAAASSRRWRCSAQPVACRKPGDAVLVSMGFDLLLIAMMAQPGGSKTFAPFFLKDLIHEPVILSGITRYTVQNKPTEPQ